MKIQIHIKDQNGDELVPLGEYRVIDAINALQGAIETLRRGAQTFDASWGEQPMPMVAPDMTA
jgi:hypothetical protein